MGYSYQLTNRRSLIAGLDFKVPLLNGSSQVAVNFDNAATTPPLKSVLLAINDFIPRYASIHRGAGQKSQYATQAYESTREHVLDFVGGDPEHHLVILVKNTTEAINKLAYRLSANSDGRNVIICTGMEHHSNDLPWRDKFQVEYVEVDRQGFLRLDDLVKKLQHNKGKVRLVTVTGASNVTGIANPIHHIASLAHQFGAEIMVDGAQLLPHRPVSMMPPDHPEHLDYLAFSGHKMYAPFGTGVLVGNRDTFTQGCSELVGGGTVDTVTHGMVIWAPPPERDEAGTPNVIGAVALSSAIKALKHIGMDKLAAEETALAAYIRHHLTQFPGLHMYGNIADKQQQLGIISFNIGDLPHELVAVILALEYGIAVRNGCFCAQPYVQSLLNIKSRDYTVKQGMVRISLGLYNTNSEADSLIAALKTITTQAPDYLKRYQLQPNGSWLPK